MSVSRLILDSSLSAASMVGNLRMVSGTNAGGELVKLSRFIEGAGTGQLAEGLKAWVNLGAVQAYNTFTFSNNPSNNETCTINGVTFTAKTSGATGNQFNIGTVAVTCANFAAAINASTTAKIANTVFATATATTVVVTCLTPGTIGNLCTATTALTNVTVTGANFANGAEGTNYILSAGR